MSTPQPYEVKYVVQCDVCGGPMHCTKCDDPENYSLFLRLVEHSRLIDEKLKLMDDKLRMLEEIHKQNRQKTQ